MVDEQAIFEVARQIDSREARQAYLQQQCGDDEVLLQRIQALLQAHEEGGSFLESPPVELAHVSANAASADQLGSHVGPYKLLQVIGEGGMGVVYLAEQSKPVRRQVALKIIKPGMDSRHVLARFDAERQALAMMDHPNIAKILDAGTFPERMARSQMVSDAVPVTFLGRPYFVMELVRGTPITEYCDSHRIGVRARLELMATVCQAVQHAHQKAIIHRDLKPSNVLIAEYDGVPVPKIIDFGLAKALDRGITEKTLFTSFGQIAGTFEYMSPEQASFNQLDIDTRSDIYSLGVLLYELLVGSTPLARDQLRSAAFEEILRVVREEEPPRPSTRLSSSDARPSIAANRQTEPERLSRLLHGDLDWITMKALEKDRNRRYATANTLAQEIHRFLAHEPVEAGPPSAWYRCLKFARRHAAAIAAAAAILTVLVAGIIGTTIGMRWALRERTRATQEAIQTRHAEQEERRYRQNAELAAEFLGSILEGVRAGIARGRDTTILREMLDAATKRIENGELAKSPEAELRLRWILGEAYLDLADDGAAKRAEEVLLPMLELSKSEYGAESEQYAIALNEVALYLDTVGRSAEALPKFDASLKLHQTIFKDENGNTAAVMNNLAFCLDALGRSDEAIAMHESALAMRKRLRKGDHRDVAESLNNLAVALESTGRYQEALAMNQEALAMLQRLFPGDHPHIAQTLCNIANCHESLGSPQKALPLYESSLEMRQRLYQGDHPDVAQGLNNLANCLGSLGRHAEALDKYDAALAMSQRLWQGDNSHSATLLNNVGFTLRALGRLEEALAQSEAALAMRQRLFAGDHPAVVSSLNNVAATLVALDRAADARPRYELAVAMGRRILSADHPDLLNAQIGLGTVLIDLERFPDAELILLDSVEKLEPNPHIRRMRTCLTQLVRLYDAWDAAEPNKGHGEKAKAWGARLAGDAGKPSEPADARGK